MKDPVYVCPPLRRSPARAFPLCQVFLDVGERRLIRTESVQRGPMLGRGAFGFVFRASYRSRHDGRYGAGNEVCYSMVGGRGGCHSGLPCVYAALV